MKLNLGNTEVAFRRRTDEELLCIYRTFKLMDYPFLVKTGTKILSSAFRLALPITSLVRGTLFKQFCGGETLKDCQTVVDRLAEENVFTILDYSVEEQVNEDDFEQAKEELFKTIDNAKINSKVPFAVFKMTAVADFRLLQKISEKSGSDFTLKPEEEKSYQRLHQRIFDIFEHAKKADVSVMVDAEETWIQKAIDDLVFEAMLQFNTEKAIVFQTVQMYRKDRLEYLQNLYSHTTKAGAKLGIKLVRGAYLEKEKKRAYDKGYENPLFETKEECDRAFDEAVRFCVDRLDNVSLFLGTHNEKSTILLATLLLEKGLSPSHPNVMFCQLYGMSDHLTFNLARSGFNASKYVPYGPIKKVLPYLIRRAEENSAIRGHAGRELQLLGQEIKRRNL